MSSESTASTDCSDRTCLEAAPFGDIKVILRDAGTNRVFPRVFDADSPVGLLKSEMEEELGLQRAEQRWTHKGRELDNDQSLGSSVPYSGAEILVEKRLE